MKRIQFCLASVSLAMASWLVAVAGATLQADAVEPGVGKTTNASASPNTSASPESAPRATRDWYPFRGEVSSVDTTRGELRLKRQSGERILLVAGKAELTRAGKVIQLGEVKVGEYARGKVRKEKQGSESLVAAAFDPEPPAPRTAKPASGSSVRKPSRSASGAGATLE